MKKLDAAMGGGLFAGKAYGLQARKKIGKTVLLGTISYNLNLTGVRHLWIAAEMNDRELEQRHLARALDYNAVEFLKGEDLCLAEQVAEYNKTAPNNIVYANAPGLTTKDLDKVLDEAVRKYDIKGFVLDYLQLVRPLSPMTRADHLEYVAQWVAAATRKHGIWAMVAAQLNQHDNTRGGEGMLLAFDMVFSLRRPKYSANAWLEMMETRYTMYQHVGSEKKPGLKLEQKGPYFSET